MLAEVLQLLKKQNVEEQERLLNSNEARALFSPKLSASTLDRWVKKGLINKKRLGGKCFYSKSEIQQAAKNLKLYKTTNSLEREPVLQ